LKSLFFTQNSGWRPIGSGADLVSQAIQARATQARSTVAIITKNVFLLPLPAMGLALGTRLLQLLFNGLRLRLPLRRNAHRDRYSHRFSPVDTSPAEAPSGNPHSIG
jgi:hypothetical protein